MSVWNIDFKKKVWIWIVKLVFVFIRREVSNENGRWKDYNVCVRYLNYGVFYL